MKTSSDLTLSQEVKNIKDQFLQLGLNYVDEVDRLEILVQSCGKA